MATNRKITSLALDCLKFYLSRFETLRPQHPNEIVITPSYVYLDDTAAKDFPIRNSGPPTWVEEQRVIRALWRTQLVYDLKQAASSLKWSEDDIAAFLKMHPMEFYQDNSLRWPLGNSQRSLYHELHPEYQEIHSVLDYIRDPHGEDANQLLALPSITLQQEEVQRQCPAAMPGPTHCKSLINASDACIFHFRAYARYLQSKSMQHAWFRYWGFAFWTHTRLGDVGLFWPNTPNAMDSTGVVLFAWGGIIPDEEDDKFSKGGALSPFVTLIPGPDRAYFDSRARWR